MKTRKRMLADQLEKVRADLEECRTDRVAVHEKLAKAEQDAGEQRVRADTAEHEHGLAVEHRDRLQAERDEARVQADADRKALTETIGMRDGWSERAQAVTVERDEALALLASQQEARHEAERKHEDLLLVTRQWEGQSREAREQADLAVTERNEAWVERDELRQALRDCRESRSIIQTQRDTILAAGAEQGIMIPMPGGPTPKLRQNVALTSGEDVPLMMCENMGEHAGHAWWGASHTGPEKRWCDGRNAGGSTPYDPALENVILKHFGVREDQSVTIEGKVVPTVVGGRAVPLDQVAAENAAIGRDPARMYDQEGEDIGPRLMPLRFEDAAFDAMRDALLAVTGTETYDPDAVSDKLRRALGMMDSSGHHARDVRDSVDWERTADHWQGVAKRMASIGDSLAADNRVLTDRANEATTRADRLERERDRAVIRLREAELKLDTERRENDAEQAELARQRDALQAERDEQRDAHEQWRSDCLVARDGYSELHSRLVGMMEERDAAVEKLESEREQGLLPPDETRQGYASYVSLRATLEAVERERDDLRTENEALNKEREDALEALGQVKSERDRLKPLALLADAVAAQSKIADATVRMDRAEAEFANLRNERDSAAVALATADARWTEVVEGVRREVGQMQVERDAARAAVSAAMGSMVLDGALENALGKLAGMLGVYLMQTDESPAALIDLAMDALKDARREAGRLKLVLDIIDERKSQQAVEVERREHGE